MDRFILQTGQGGTILPQTQMRMMTLDEKLTVGARVATLRKAGRKAEAEALNRTIPLAPHLAQCLKEQIGLDALLKAGLNLTEAVAAYGPDFISR
jgi:hypothetical protein